MKTNKTKRTYEKPAVRRIQLDSEISLVMQSSPMGNPSWAKSEESSTPNPFRDEESSC